MKPPHDTGQKHPQLTWPVSAHGSGHCMSMKELLNNVRKLLNPHNHDIATSDCRGVDRWLGDWMEVLRSNGEVCIGVEKHDVQRSIYHGALALSIIVEAFACQYNSTPRSLLRKMRRERLKAVPHVATADDYDPLLLGLSMIHDSPSTWFTDTTYRDVIGRVVDEYGMDESVDAMSTVAMYLCRFLSSKHSRTDVVDIALRVSETFVHATGVTAAISQE